MSIKDETTRRVFGSGERPINAVAIAYGLAKIREFQTPTYADLTKALGLAVGGGRTRSFGLTL